MKTTLELPDDLLIAAKQAAIRRRTTLKELIMRSLRREIGFDQAPAFAADSPYEISEIGLPRLKKRGAVVTVEQINSRLEEADAEDFRDALELHKP